MILPPLNVWVGSALFFLGVLADLPVARAAGSTTNQPGYQLGPGPFTVQNLGSVLSANTLDRQIMFADTNNDKHLILYYDNLANTALPLEILDVNLTRNTWRLTNGIPGRPGTYGTSLYYNGHIYLGSSDPGYFMEYDPIAGNVRQIAKLSVKSCQVTQIGDDGWIYIGEMPYANVDRYNPANNVFQNLGAMDTNDYQYAYTIGADSRYLYIGVGESRWYLGVYDTQTTNRTTFWKDQSDLASAVYHGSNGFWYYIRSATNGTMYYILTNGSPIQVTSLPPLQTAWYVEHDSVVNDKSSFASIFEINVNVDHAYPDGSSNHALVEWCNVGATSLTSINATGFDNLLPVTIKRLYAWDNNRLLGSVAAYGALFSYNPANATTTTLGYPQFSLYDITFDGNTIFLSGYPDATLQCNTNLAWTLTASTTNQALSNPSLTPARFGKYHYYTSLGADGLIYIGAHHERDSTGGELGWYDPINLTKGSLRSPFLNDDVADLKPALGGSKLVYASSGSTNLFVFDVATKSIERTIIPLPGIQMDKIVEAAPGIIFGATGTNIFEVNVTNGSVLYSKTVPGLAFGSSAIQPYDHRLTLGPDGYVWMFLYANNTNTLYRINPSDGSYAGILTNSMAVYGDNRLLFNGGDLYLYGGTNLYRISGLLVPVGPAIKAPQNVHVLPSGR